MMESALSTGTVEEFDSTADIVVIGFGIAGACAALEAKRSGGDVLVLERASAGGGASAISSGLFYLGGGTAVQSACGYDDSADKMYRYMLASMGSEKADIIRRYADDSVDHFNWLEAQGVPFERSSFAGKAVFLLGTEGLMSTGNEKLWPYKDIAQPVPRGHQVAGEGESPGAVAMEALINRCIEEGVRVSCNSQVLGLILDTNGRVSGVRFRQFGQDLSVKANRAVIMATGGFVMNQELVHDNISCISDTAEPLGIPYNDGAGILMANAVGAVNEAMGGVIATASIYPPAQLIKGIIVNKYGRRFVAEDSYHGRTAAFIMEQPEQRAFLIVDEEIFAYPEIESARHSLIDGFETVEEMEQRLEIAPGALVKCLSEYNEDAAQGTDRLFHKHRDWLKPLDHGPYAVFDISFNRSSYFYLTLGGLKTNVDAEVMDSRGAPIKGLYAAGACTAHIPESGKTYNSGMSLGPGSYFGRIAGRKAMEHQDIEGGYHG